jgi:hypothetical protein
MNGTKYVRIRKDDWERFFTLANGYRIVGRSEAGYTMTGPTGDVVFWDDDEKVAYKVLPSRAVRR